MVWEGNRSLLDADADYFVIASHESSQDICQNPIDNEQGFSTPLECRSFITRWKTFLQCLPVKPIPRRAPYDQRGVNAL